MIVVSNIFLALYCFFMFCLGLAFIFGFFRRVRKTRSTKNVNQVKVPEEIKKAFCQIMLNTQRKENV